MRNGLQQVRDMTLVAGGLIVALIVVAFAVAINVDYRAAAVATRLDGHGAVERLR